MERPLGSDVIRDLRDKLARWRQATDSTQSCFTRWIEDALQNDKVTQAAFPTYNGKTKP